MSKRENEKTGYAHPKCYARRTNSCSEKISGEHYFSESVLRQVGESIRVTGAPWLEKGESKNIPISGLRSNVLCKHHNSILSPLDAVGGKLFEILTGRFGSQMAVNLNPTVIELSGDLLQRWFLKVLSGASAGRLGRKKTGERIEFEPDGEWLELLFTDRIWPPGTGLYALGEVGEKVYDIPGISIAPMTAPDTVKVNGAIFSVRGCRFALTVGQVPSRSDLRKSLRGAIYRPSTFKFGKKHLVLTWNNRSLPRELRYILRS